MPKFILISTQAILNRSPEHGSGGRIESNLSKTKNIPPKAVIFSDFCCTFAISTMMVGAPCVFEVSPEKSVLTFNVEGERKTYSLEGASEQLFKK